MNDPAQYRDRAAEAARRANDIRSQGSDPAFFEGLARHWTVVAENAEWVEARRLKAARSAWHATQKAE
jgi:hypothetical protein